MRLPNADVTVTAAPSQHFSGRGLEGPQHDAVVVAGDPFAAPCRVFQRRYRIDHGVRSIRERLGPFDLVMLEVGAFHPAWGDIHLGPENALEALGLLGGGSVPAGALGHLCLAMHAWDQPAERLLEIAPRLDTPLLMPLLGQPVEPAQADIVKPWWRDVESTHLKPPPDTEGEIKLPDSVPWPLD